MPSATTADGVPRRFMAHAAAATAMIRRDVRLFLRRPSRIAATVLTPAMLWAFFAAGFLPGLRDGGGREYTISLSAGASLLVATFAAIFGALSLIRDRESGALQALLVGATPRAWVIGARVASGAAFAFVQGVPMLVAAVVLAGGVSLGGLLSAAIVLLAAGLGIAGVCTALAWHFDSIEGFHGIMSGLLMPAWLLSGAVFPPDAVSPVLDAVMAVNPLTYAHDAVRTALAGKLFGISSVATSVGACAGCLAAILAARGDAKR